MPLSVEIDERSGFCGGVIRAINHAEEFLGNEGDRQLYSLGSIVHNEAELKRLEGKGLSAIDKVEDLKGRPGATMLIRAHGEPPQTYEQAESLDIKVIDCTCPVVLKLQEHIREAYGRIHPLGGQIIIFGKVGHAEVLGLVGQVDGDAVVVENMKMLREAIADGKINLRGPIEMFSQTTKSPAEYASICTALEEAMSPEGQLTTHNTICRQVASRHELLSSFALSHDVIVFVAGKDSSNGKVLCDLCKSLNIRTVHVGSPEDLRPEWFRDDDRVGVCGATSTPKWLLESVAQKILQLG